MAQLVAGFAELDSSLFQHVQNTGELTVHSCQFTNQLFCRVQLALQINVFAVCHDSQCLLAGGEQLPAVSQTLVLFINLFKFTWLRVEFVQFF